MENSETKNVVGPSSSRCFHQVLFRTLGAHQQNRCYEKSRKDATPILILNEDIFFVLLLTVVVFPCFQGISQRDSSEDRCHSHHAWGPEFDTQITHSEIQEPN